MLIGVILLLAFILLFIFVIFGTLLQLSIIRMSIKFNIHWFLALIFLISHGLALTLRSWMLLLLLRLTLDMMKQRLLFPRCSTSKFLLDLSLLVTSDPMSRFELRSTLFDAHFLVWWLWGSKVWFKTGRWLGCLLRVTSRINWLFRGQLFSGELFRALRFWNFSDSMTLPWLRVESSALISQKIVAGVHVVPDGLAIYHLIVSSIHKVLEGWMRPLWQGFTLNWRNYSLSNFLQLSLFLLRFLIENALWSLHQHLWQTRVQESDVALRVVSFLIVHSLLLKGGTLINWMSYR